MERMSIPSDRSAELVAEIGFEPAFTVVLESEPAEIFHTPRGDRIFRRISGGTITGRISGDVYPDGAGEYSLRREDGVIDVDAHILLRDDSVQREWLYLRNIGFRRPDGYYRVTSWVDADVRGGNDWVLGLFFVGLGRPSEDGGSLSISYFEVT